MFAVGIDLPGTFGATAPKGNYADMTTRGWEVTLGWRDDFSVANKPFNYDIKFTLSDYVSKIDRYNNTEMELGNYYDARVNYNEGMTLGNLWGYLNEGNFLTIDDIIYFADYILNYTPNYETLMYGN